MAEIEVVVKGMNPVPAGAHLPEVISKAGEGAVYAYEEILAKHRQSDHSHEAYRRAMDRFLEHVRKIGLAVHEVRPKHVSDYIRNLANLRTGSPAAPKTRRLHLAAIRTLFRELTLRHAVIVDPTGSITGPKEESTEGKTPAIPKQRVRSLFEQCDISTVVGLRNRAILGTLVYTGVRRGAVAKLVCETYNPMARVGGSPSKKRVEKHAKFPVGTTYSNGFVSIWKRLT